MALSWCKVASNLDSHPKIRKAGRLGREVFLFALRRNAEPNNKSPGRISKDELDPDYVSQQLMMDVTDAVTGVTAACHHGLLREEADCYVIVAWGGIWGRGSDGSAERMAKHRENKKLQGCDGGGDGSDVTERHSDRSDIEERRGEESTSPPKGDERDVALATLLARKVVGNYPKHALTRLSPKAKNKRIQQWAEHVRKMRELDGHSESEIGHLIEWCQSDGFWKKNIQSTETLREKWDRLDADMQQGRSSAPKVIRIAEPGDDTPPLFRLPGAK